GPAHGRRDDADQRRHHDARVAHKPLAANPAVVISWLCRGPVRSGPIHRADGARGPMNRATTNRASTVHGGLTICHDPNDPFGSDVIPWARVPLPEAVSSASRKSTAPRPKKPDLPPPAAASTVTTKSVPLKAATPPPASQATATPPKSAAEIGRLFPLG